MKSLDELIKSYSSYHRDPRNKALHFLGVPTVTFSLFIAMGWVRFQIFDLPITLAFLFAVAVLIYYFFLDIRMSLILAFVFGLLLYGANEVALLPSNQSLSVFIGTFVLGWIFQFLGHYYEGRRPALFDNILQIFAAPLFLIVEIFTLLGLRPPKH